MRNLERAGRGIAFFASSLRSWAGQNTGLLARSAKTSLFSTRAAGTAWFSEHGVENPIIHADKYDR